MTLQSHNNPFLFLADHLAQVQQAAHFILSCHSQLAIQSRLSTATMIKAIVQCHDLGKASPAFQDYIRDPQNYIQPQHLRKKSHALLSAVIATLWAQQEQWQALDTLVLTQAAACHHYGFRHLSELENALRLDFEDPLTEQYAALDLNLLTELTGLNLSQIDNDDFESARRWLFKKQKIEKQLQQLSLVEALSFRLWTQFCFSVLLEADKALLALHEAGATQYLQKTTSELLPIWIDHYLSQRTRLTTTPLDEFRATLQTQVMLNSQQISHPCLTLTLPTGAGKTLLAARWAFITRQQMTALHGVQPKIVIVLPYLSIIDQVEKIYHQILGIETEDANTERYMASHSLSDSQYELEGKTLSDQYAEFFLNTWRSEVVVTTFDQFLLAIFSTHNKHLMRFHNLMDAIIILDEVQTLPVILWDIINQTLQAIAVIGHSKILMMSATQPHFLTPTQELVGTHKQVTQIFKQCQRYQIHLHQGLEQPITAFIDQLIDRVEAWLDQQKRILITLNTRAAAKRVWKALHQAFAHRISVHLISADVTPRDRLAKIQQILTDMHHDNPCLVVSTQTVEAGVDIDMDVVIRDFAPLDKIIQVAGRCNRNDRRGKWGGYIEVVQLLSSTGQKYANYIYDPILLHTTHEILEPHEIIKEEDILAISDSYFQSLHKKMNTGKALTQQYAYWQELEKSIHAWLRPQGEQISFIVLNDPAGELLRTQIEAAIKIKDRWQRRHALQKLAGQINERSVNVYKRSGFYPEEYAEQLHCFFILKAGYYDSESGLDLKLDEADPAACIF